MSDRGASPSGAPRNEGWNLHEYLGILRARRWTFLGVSSLIVVIVALFTFSMRPVYRATCLLLIEPKGMNVAKVEGVYDPITAGLALNDYYRTQFEILRSRRIMGPASGVLKLTDRPEFKNERDPIEAFTNIVSIEPIRESRLVRVSVESHDRAFATDAANAIVQQFVDENNERTLGISDTGLKKLKEMEHSLRPKYEAAARALQDFKDSNSMYFLDESQSIAVQQLKLLSEELTKARADHARAAAECKTLAAALKGDKVEGPLPVFLPSKTLDDLKVELSKVEQDRDDLLKHYTKDHPTLKAADARVARIRAHYEAEQKSIVKTMDAKLAAETERVTELEAGVAKAESVVADLGRKAVRLQFLKAESDTVAVSYKNVARRIEEVEVAIATGTKENNLFVVDRALLPTHPVRPKKLMNLVLGSFFAAVAALALCLVLEFLDQTIKGKEDAEALLGYPLLGFVPRVEIKEAGAPAEERRVPIELTAIHAPRGEVAESFRTIRTGLAFTLPAAGPTAIVITSATPGDGKSFVSINLANSLAQTGKRILLVDADLRRPRLHSVFGLETVSVGLSTTIVSSDTATLDAVQKTRVPTLDILPAGPLPPNPAELLGGSAFRAFLDRALTQYDWVLLDAPPLAAVADPAILIGSVRHAIFVVRALTTLRGDALRARELLERTQGVVAGMILNTVDLPTGKKDGYYYRYGSYREDRAAGPRAQVARIDQPPVRVEER